VTGIGQFGAWSTLNGFSAELFATAQRALANSAAGVASVARQGVSFLLAGVLIGLTYSLARSVGVLPSAPPRPPGGTSTKTRLSPPDIAELPARLEDAR
jgi:hypothetical protein